MTAPETTLAALALIQALPDTVVTVQAGSRGLERWVDLATSIASIVIALALLSIAIPLIPAAWNSRKFYKRINDSVNRLRTDVDPLVRHAISVGENLDFISTALREDVRKLQQMVDTTHRRLDHAAGQAEARVNELNALLKVVQEEAEDLFIGTASTVRGVRAGAERFRRFQEESLLRGERRRRGDLDEELDDEPYDRAGEDEMYAGPEGLDEEDLDDDAEPEIRVVRRRGEGPRRR